MSATQWVSLPSLTQRALALQVSSCTKRVALHTKVLVASSEQATWPSWRASHTSPSLATLMSQSSLPAVSVQPRGPRQL
ncbi:MAG: hypothetical protein QM756_27655 [Polyangiaceae bacterium]